ncbi:hypothetical protein A2311_03105 [candidate division WOR-1 bacterium RIFOXYB2_FULL_48_7]|uniref:Chorismate-utilising enzyme C-terminal domain-containing protein n=1 Tax=candidate division WOR-1 bacterium RIFOXYB2_FULL_48_7 TaxID=1802583 RepID=A0A1F4TRF4_UNCSA|nr:MAG: hypothetical protein A2311_03105 [candidate division WOR-1 bacterium RIFOXYB2_FULL_48_7]
MVFLYCEIGNQLFERPLKIIQTKRLSELAACFEQMEKASASGHYLAGWLSYEAGYAFEPKLIRRTNFDFPLLQFGVYPAAGKVKKSKMLRPLPLVGCFNLGPEQYQEKIGRIQEYIVAGETYQITFCLKQKFAYEGNPKLLYRQLLDFQPVPYPAFIETDDLTILSFSPELFFEKQGEKITVKPMKGTLFRDNSWLNALLGGWQLHYDAKNRAENVMIADLLRNDLGKICHYGSVQTPKLFEVARYRTVYQMTSTVQGRLYQADMPYYEIFRALFPSGSVTGAPKLRAMQIIRELENEERRIYTGAIGFITPQREMRFNVPIRTILLQGREGEMGVGGGITHYSTPQGEYEECQIKARFLQAAL